MPDLKRRFHDVIKRWKNWLLFVALGFVALLYMGPVLWQAVQDGNLTALFAISVFLVTVISIIKFALQYLRVVFVAVVGMVIGAVAGFVPYFVIVIILLLLEQSPVGQATSRQLSQLFDNDLFGQLFYVAGAASGGPIAVLVYFKEKKMKMMKKIAAENDKDR